MKVVILNRFFLSFQSFMEFLAEKFAIAGLRVVPARRE